MNPQKEDSSSEFDKEKLLMTTYHIWRDQYKTYHSFFLITQELNTAKFPLLLLMFPKNQLF